MNKKKTSTLLNPKSLKNFGICVFVASILWISSEFSEIYRHTFSYPIYFETQLPLNTQILQSEKDIQITITTNGFGMLYHKLAKKNKQLRFSIEELGLHKTDGRAVFQCKKYKNSIFQQLGYKNEEFTILTDSVVLTWESTYEKRVKPILDVNLEFLPQYELYGNPIIYPNQVTIYGTEKSLKNIKEVYTKEVTLTGLDRSGYHIFLLKNMDKYPEVSIPLPYILVYLPVEKFTEIEMEVPIHTEYHANEQIRIFPDKAKVISLVALKDYKRVQSDMFVVSTDYDSEKTIGSRLPLRLVQFPDFVKFQKIQPEEVDYVIIRK